jgi:hypothetical protein
MLTLSPADLPSVQSPASSMVAVALAVAGLVLMGVTVSLYRFSDAPATRGGVLVFLAGAAAVVLGLLVGTALERPTEAKEDGLYGPIVRQWLQAEYGLTVSEATAETLINESDCGVNDRRGDGDRCGAFFMGDVDGERRHLAVHLDETDGQYVVREIDRTLVPVRAR